MRTYLLSFGLILTLISAASIGGSAQAKQLNGAPAAFKNFFTKFRNAVERSRKSEVAAMTKFPFSYGYDAGDEGTYSRAQFIKSFSMMFGPRPRYFFTETAFSYSRDGSDHYVNNEDATHLRFVKSGSTFKFVSFVVEP